MSNLINLIGHYKNWAIKEHLRPTIYLVYTTSDLFKNSVRIPGYREYYKRISDDSNMEFFHVNQAMKGAIFMLPVIVKYIPGAYAINSRYLEPSAVPMLIASEHGADWNILVSRDEYDLQYSYQDKWTYISPKGDMSRFVDKNSLWQYICHKAKIEGDQYFNPDLFIIIKSILGDKYRSIPKLTRTGWKTIINLLMSVSTSEPCYDLQMEAIAKYIDKKKIDGTSYDNNLYVTDVNIQVKSMLDSEKVIIFEQIEDMEDAATLTALSNTTFKEFPINIPFLLRVSPGKNDTPHDKYFWER